MTDILQFTNILWEVKILGIWGSLKLEVEGS